MCAFTCEAHADLLDEPLGRLADCGGDDALADIIDDLDDAEAAAAEGDERASVDSYELEDVQQFLAESAHDSLVTMLRLTPWERLRWCVGERLAPEDMAGRIFRFLDTNRSGTMSVGALDLLVKHLQGHLKFGKATFELVEVPPLSPMCRCRPAFAVTYAADAALQL